MGVCTISVGELHRLREEGRARDLIDVRTPAEFASVHVTGAKSLPLHRLDSQSLATARSSNGDGNGHEPPPVYFICRGGSRSLQACEKMMAAGVANVVNVDGGTEAWRKAGFPVERGRWALPLDRQVQSVAGVIALSGVALGALVNPWWFALCALVGTGLTMAGLTGFCPMGELLARMPWNRGASCR